MVLDWLRRIRLPTPTFPRTGSDGGRGFRRGRSLTPTRLRWTVPDGGWKDTGGPLVHLQFGRATPQQVFGADGWGLDWLLPPGGVAVDCLLMHDLRWEHLVASALSPMGTGGLDEFTPTVVVPHVGRMIDRLLGAGFSKCYLKKGGESYLGAWAMDCAWNALQVFHGEVRSTAKGGWLGNETYIAAATQMAADCGVQLSEWTTAIGGTVKPVAVGNVIEAYATLLVRERAWGEFSSIVYYIARHDVGGLSRLVAGRPQVGVTGQIAPPPPCPAPAAGGAGGVGGAAPAGAAPAGGVLAGAPRSLPMGARPPLGPGSRRSRLPAPVLPYSGL